MRRFASSPAFGGPRRAVWAIGSRSAVRCLEMRVDDGAGYRLYFTRRANVVIVMLAGGDKSTQSRDIRRARRILEQLELEP